MNEEIPIAKPMRTKRQCQQCGAWTGCVYVKRAGFISPSWKATSDENTEGTRRDS